MRAGAAKGHNTDGFDCSGAKDLTITHATVYNQDVSSLFLVVAPFLLIGFFLLIGELGEPRKPR